MKQAGGEAVIIHALDEKLKQALVGRGNDGVRSLNELAAIPDPEVCVLTREEAHRMLECQEENGQSITDGPPGVKTSCYRAVPHQSLDGSRAPRSRTPQASRAFLTKSSPEGKQRHLRPALSASRGDPVRPLASRVPPCSRPLQRTP